MVLQRIDYWNRVTSTVRTGDTRRDETVTDVESFMLPYLQAVSAGLHLWGVATGLTVTATAGQSGVRVSPGCALDSAGRVVVLSAGSVAVVDPDIDPGDVTSIPTVSVDGTGVGLGTAGISGQRLVTIRYQEASASGPLGNDPTLVHAPWLRLVDVAGFADEGLDVVLGSVTLSAGSVTALQVGPRRQVGVPTGRLQLHRPMDTSAGTLSVGHAPAAELRPRPDGGVDVEVRDLDGSARTAVTIDAEGRLGVGVASALRPVHTDGSVHSGGTQGGFSFADRTDGSFVEDPPAGQRWIWYADKGTARLWSKGDRLSVAANGNVAIGIDASQAKRPLHVEGSEIHSGGGVAGYSFADRSVGSFVEFPNAGQRWVWYATGRTARLWSGGDRMSVSANGNVAIGIDASQAKRPLHVEGSEIHSGGGVAGYSFADRSVGSFVESPNTGQRWVWYASQSSARLWSGSDRLTISDGGTTWIAGKDSKTWAAFGASPLFSGKVFAGLFFGDVKVNGTLTKAAVNFQIDHPLDPANKYLNHCSIESDEMKNIYDGVVVLDDDGGAQVDLPDWLEALNEDFRYQLTPIGASAPGLHISAEVADGCFAIAGGPPHIKVSWLVSGIRHDAYAKAHPLQVESAKARDESGLFLHPVEHAQPASRSMATLYTPPPDPSPASS